MDSSYLKEAVESLKQEGTLRSLTESAQKGAMITVDGREYLNFSGNDYLGITDKLQWQSEFLKELSSSNFQMSSVSSRLLTGNHAAYGLVEKKLASLFQSEASLLFNTGYHANIGILPAVTTAQDLIIADKLVHASIIDGLKLCSAKWTRYRHNDYRHLAQLISENRAQYRNVWVVTESVFSMDGDCANIHQLVALKKEHNLHLYIDEAHAFGAVGQKGLGVCVEQNLAHEVDILVGTFGKALASMGAFAICSNTTRQWLISSCRSQIFSTALPPINLLWTLFLLEKLDSLQKQRQQLQRCTQLFRSILEKANIKVLGTTHIIPIVLGANNLCLAAAQRLRDESVWAMAIRHPTVPQNQARIWFSLSAAHTPEQVEHAALSTIKILQDATGVDK